MSDDYKTDKGKAALKAHLELMKLVRAIQGLAAGDYHGHGCTPYALDYCDAALYLPMNYRPNELPGAMASQALYILSNLTTWRGPRAKSIKNELQQFADKARKL